MKQTRLLVLYFKKPQLCMASSVDKNSESFYNEAEISERKATYSLPLWKKIPVFLLKRLKTSVTEVNCEK